jgi:hypothetical protein
MMSVHLEWINNGQFTSSPWSPVALLKMVGWKATSEAFGWLQDNNGSPETRYSSTFHAVGQTIDWDDSGSHVINAKCWHIGGILIPVSPTA